MVRRPLVGRVMVAVGVVGVAVSIVAVVVGLRLLSELDRALAGGVGALGSSVEETVVVLERGLQQTESTTRDLVTAFADAEAALGATADLTEGQVAESLEAVEQSMPALVAVGAVIDRTLSALNAVPLGSDYRPEEPFDDSLRSLQRAMEGLPDDLREQAALIRSGKDSLGKVRQGTEAIADDLGTLHAALRSVTDVMGDSSTPTAEAGDQVDRSDAGRKLTTARVLVVVLGVTLLAGQVVPLGIGWLLLHPEAAAAFLSEDRR